MRLPIAALVSLCAFIGCTTSCEVQGSCTETDQALKHLESQLSPSAVIACRGSAWQLYNAGRYWGEQYGQNASVVVYPVTKEDVSHAVVAAGRTPIGFDFAFVSGAHSMTNSSSATGFIIDLSWMNTTQVLTNVTVADTTIGTAIAYQGGATWGAVNNATADSGYIAVGARVSSVGVGGFSTGGGIGFLAGTYGYATDRLRAMEVVLLTGEIVEITKTNEYSDLFWALQGGNGQFAIVTTFYQEAALEPTLSQLAVYVVANSSMLTAKQNTVAWFDQNDDPYALMYYGVGYLPDELFSGPYGIQNVMIGVRFGDPTNPAQKSFNETFAPLLEGVDIDLSVYYTLPYADLTDVIDGFFPYGFRRGFWGPQTTNITVDYLSDMDGTLDSYISAQLSKADLPPTGLWVLQYMFPGLNGHLPANDSSTAWPHAVSAHQTLFSPAWNYASDDALVVDFNNQFNEITWNHQATVGPYIYDYPNYISPGDSGYRVYGNNVERLIQIKQKYDPLCRIHNGRVFATEACILLGKASFFV